MNPTPGLKRLVQRVSAAYDALYDRLCGRHPDELPWHFQWLAVRELRRDLRSVLAGVNGAVLDFGCGMQPYRKFLSTDVRYTGVDVMPAPGVRVIAPHSQLPYADGTFDSVLCTQVLEHVDDAQDRLAEMERVLKPGGALILSIPFIFHLHGRPYDFWRFSEYGARKLLAGYEIESVHRQGAVGSTLATLLLGWMDHQTHVSKPAWAVRVVCMPLWIAFCLLANLVGIVFDYLDSTGAFYNNVLLVARKRSKVS